MRYIIFDNPPSSKQCLATTSFRGSLIPDSKNWQTISTDSPQNIRDPTPFASQGLIGEGDSSRVEPEEYEESLKDGIFDGEIDPDETDDRSLLEYDRYPSQSK